MKKLLSLILVIGFVIVDFLFFHDIFKSGEIITLPQYLTGLLSIPVLLLSIQSLLARNQRSQA